MNMISNPVFVEALKKVYNGKLVGLVGGHKSYSGSGIPLGLGGKGLRRR